MAKMLHCQSKLLQPATSMREPGCSCIQVLADTIEVCKPLDARRRKVCAGSHEHVMHLTDTSLRPGSAQASKTASGVRQDFSKVAKEAIMTVSCGTEEQGKEMSWGAAPILPPARRKGDTFLVRARAKRLLKGAQYQCTWAAWWLSSLLWHLHKDCRGCYGVKRHLTCMIVLAFFQAKHLRLLLKPPELAAISKAPAHCSS